MDLNLVVLAGRLAAPPEFRVSDSGAFRTRYLVTVRSSEPTRRVDVVPVTIWDESGDADREPAVPGSKLWVAGSVQRMFWSDDASKRSRLEIVAHQVEIRDPHDLD